MAWFALRTAPGAQMPQRTYVTETTGRGKGYRIVPTINRNVSAIEVALAVAGFVAYMPAQRRIVRSRTKANTWTTRRFPLLPGWVFVHDPVDWRLLCQTSGVQAIAKSAQGVPYQVPLPEIEEIRMIEAETDSSVDLEMARRAAAEARLTRSGASRLFPIGSRIELAHGPFTGRRGHIVGTDRDGRIKAIVDGLNALGVISVPVDAVRLAS